MKCPTCGREHKRSSEQNRRLHAIFNLMQDQLTDKNGQKQHAQWWKVCSKAEWLGFMEFRKPDGSIIQVLRSTADCSVEELNKFMETVERYCAKRGVYLED